MPKRTNQKPPAACTEKPNRLRLVVLNPRSSVSAARKSAVAAFDGLDLRGIDLRCLRELEAENTKLRITAIQLALEIQDLRMGRLAAV
jgi:hypothetical protein